MFPSFLITFRETLEVALVVGVVLTFLSKTNQQIYKKFVWRGIGVGVAISIVIGMLLHAFFGGLPEKIEPIFEGILMFVTAGFLTWMILWVHQQKDIAKKIKTKVSQHIEKGYGLGIFILTATSVFREGTETVLYLKASSLLGQSGQLIGAILGIVIAIGIGYALFSFAFKINLKYLFTATNIFLLLFAAGLVSHGVHEFQEVGVLPTFSFDPIYNISHILSNNSLIGSFLRTLFGYTSNPTVLEIVSYASYIFFIIWLQKATDRMIIKN